MTVAVDTQVDRAQAVLQDTTGIRWPETELIDWMNDAQREVVMLSPKAGASTESFALSASSSLQNLPTGGIQFLRVTRNIGGRAVRAADRDILDSQLPDWHNTAGSEVQHYVHDPVDPTTFYIYPQPVTGSVELVYAKAPAIVAAGGNLSVPDIYANAVLDYTLYRAYSKDAEATANRELAALHYQRFAESLGLKAQADAANLYQSGVARSAPVGS